jgi:hypothetical protein
MYEFDTEGPEATLLIVDELSMYLHDVPYPDVLKDASYR